jgi:hypothetical protein
MARDPDFKIAGTLSLTPKFAGTTTRAREKKRLRERTRARTTERKTPRKKGKDLSDLIERANLCPFNSADTFIRLANRSEINSS